VAEKRLIAMVGVQKRTREEWVSEGKRVTFIFTTFLSQKINGATCQSLIGQW